MPLIHDGPARATLSIELTRPVPLQEVAEGIFCGSPAELVEERHDDGLSDDESDIARRVSPQVTLLSSVVGLFPHLARVYVGAARAAASNLGGVPLGETALAAAGGQTASATWRHDPYRPVLPAWLLTREDDEESLPEAEVPFAEGGEVYEWADGAVVEPSTSSYLQDDWDAPKASTAALSSSTSPSTAPGTSRMLADPFAGVEEELWRENEDPSSEPATATVMCCYFKQFGRCKMGADCWYSHTGTASTPCHYGGICKAGHAHLVKTGNASVPPKRTADSKARPRPSHHRERAAAEPTPTAPAPRPKTVGPSAPLTPSNLPCAFCGDSQGVLLQEFPVYEGNARRMAYRAHCINPSCMRVYSL